MLGRSVEQFPLRIPGRPLSAQRPIGAVPADISAFSAQRDRPAARRFCLRSQGLVDSASVRLLRRSPRVARAPLGCRNGAARAPFTRRSRAGAATPVMRA